VIVYPRHGIIAGEPELVTPAAALPLSLTELRAQCRLTDDDGTDEDALLMGYLRAGIAWCEGETKLSLISQVWSQTFSGFPPPTWYGHLYRSSPMILGRRPVQSIELIEYLDASGSLQTVDSAVYRISGRGSSTIEASLRAAANQAWPSVYTDVEAVTVTYTAGFGDTHNDVPEDIRHALMMLVSYWFNQREASLIDPVIVDVPFGTRVLLERWRPIGVA
jgi:uncharacterized phiE125 gp8 family phage protein